MSDEHVLCYGGASTDDVHLLATVHAVDEGNLHLAEAP